MAEGPCLVIVWRDVKSKSLIESRYFPDASTSMADGESYCFEWFSRRRAKIRSMTWHWGEIPEGISRTKIDL